MHGLAAIVLAAGTSSRMRVQKPLLPFAGSTLLERAVRAFLDAGVLDVSVVIGHQGHRLRPVVRDLGVRCVANAAHEQGMYSSVVAGLSSLPAEVEAAFVLPADMPAVRPQTVELLARAFRASHPAVVHPVFRGKRGHPPLLSRPLFEAVLEGSGAGGLRQVLRSFDGQACEVPVLDAGVLLDLDTPAEYRAARAAGC